MQPSLPDSHLGRSIGRYRLTRILGEGGMGMVFEATHETLGRRAAVKILLPHCSLQPDLLRRFFDEARAANLLEHPSLVQIFECGQLDDGTAFLIMEFLSGRSLRARVVPEGLAPADVCRLGFQIAEALAAAHAKGIVHRDLKPENLMVVFDPVALNRERIKILDFGIAKLIDDRPQHLRTDAKVVMGTPSYMSPEQCMGAGLVSFPSDVYSLGVVLYEMVAGHTPFSAESHAGILVQHLSTAAPPLPATSQTDEELNRLILSMLAKDAELRPTMAAVATLLEQMAKAYAIAALPTPRRIRSFFKQSTLIMSGGPVASLPGRRQRRPLWLLAGFVALMLSGTGLYVLRSSTKDRPIQGTAPPRFEAAAMVPGTMGVPQPGPSSKAETGAAANTMKAASDPVPAPAPSKQAEKFAPAIAPSESRPPDSPAPRVPAALAATKRPFPSGTGRTSDSHRHTSELKEKPPETRRSEKPRALVDLP